MGVYRWLIVAVSAILIYATVIVTHTVVVDGRYPLVPSWINSVALALLTLAVLAITGWTAHTRNVQTTSRLEHTTAAGLDALATSQADLGDRMAGVASGLWAVRRAGERIAARLDAVEARLAALEGPTHPLPVLHVVGSAKVVEAPDLPPLPPDNVRAFELGRRAERAARGIES